jgi:osmotically-inducible protein OsmY
MSNNDIEKWVTDELQWDPKIDSAEIAASAHDGEVTLRGTVGSFRQKREAQNAAERVHGVTSVKNELQVRILTGDARDDAELRGSVLQAMMLDSVIPGTIDAQVEDGWVTLTGKTDWKYQRDEAEFVAGNVAGVIGVDDQVVIENLQPNAGDVRESIETAFERNAKLEAKDLSVDTHDGTVVLTGTVNSWSEHDAALTAAWAAPGVTNVDDYLVVDN